MTKQERQHYDKLFNLGCIACYHLGYGYSFPEIHHVRHGAGIGRRSEFDKTIPLCPHHHRLGGYGVAYHAGRIAFEQRVGKTETELLKLTLKLIGVNDEGL